MKVTSDTLPAKLLAALVVIVLVAMPLYALLTVWLASLTGHYTALRLWKEVLLVIMAVLAAGLLTRRPDLRRGLWAQPLIRRTGWLIRFYIALHVLIGGLALWHGDVTAKALGYALISNLRFLFFLTICVVAGTYYRDWFIANWKKLLLWPAAIVVGFGLLQFLVLPADFLKHFGYGLDTIKPYIAVDQKPEFARVQSSLRGPNPLGAYLVIIVTALTGLFFVRKTKYVRVAAALFATLIVLYGTYSRSAWIGALLAVLLLTWALSKPQARTWLTAAGAITLLIGAGTVFVLRDNDYVQNVVFHTDETSQAGASSNEHRADAITNSTEDLVREPLGRGPGTAGPASVYNDNSARISENYFLQIGQEVGVIGLGLFAAINVMVGMLLWRARNEGIWPLIMLASLVGISAVNLFSHAWADDTLAYVWWGFAGLSIGVCSSKTAGKKADAAKTV